MRYEADFLVAEWAVCYIGISCFRLDHFMFASFALLVILLLNRATAHNTSGKVGSAELAIRCCNTNPGRATFSRTLIHLFVMVGRWMARENIHCQGFVLFFLVVSCVRKVFQFDEGAGTLFVVPSIERA